MLKKKIWPNFPRIIVIFAQKTVTKLSKKYSEFRIPDPGVKKAPYPGSGSTTLKGRIRIRNNLKRRTRIRTKSLVYGSKLKNFGSCVPTKLHVTGQVPYFNLDLWVRSLFYFQ